MNILTVPGITNTTLTSHALNVATDRGDTLFITDLEGDYTPRDESTATEASRMGSVSTTISKPYITNSLYIQHFDI